MTADLCTENSRVHRLLSGMEEMRFVFLKYYIFSKNFISFKNISIFNESIFVNSDNIRSLKNKNILYQKKDLILFNKNIKSFFK